MEVWNDIWGSLNAPLFSLGGDPVTVVGILVLAAIVIATFVAAGRARSLFERWIGRVTGMEETNLHAMGALMRYAILFLGLYIGVRSMGVQLDSLLVVMGAVGVGIGFGLQNVTNNFVSGLILLSERPVKLGDIVDVGGSLGTIERIGIRATTLRKFDQTQAIVPNGDLISQVVTNWTHDDRRVRIDFIVGVAYGSDTQLVRRLVNDVVTDNTSVLEDPEPRVLFVEFGDSSLNFRVLAYVGDIGDRLGTLSDLHFGIDAAFREHDIEIPFPQRDLHLRSISPGVELAHAAAD